MDKVVVCGFCRSEPVTSEFLKDPIPYEPTTTTERLLAAEKATQRITGALLPYVSNVIDL